MGAVFSGQMMTLFYSLGGGLLAWLIMCLLRPVFHKEHLWLCSPVAALFHNLGQLLVAAAIMRTGMYEVLYVPDVPNAAAINEAVEIAKRYETQEVVSFVNGILGSFVRAEFADTPPKPEKADDSQPKAED